MRKHLMSKVHIDHTEELVLCEKHLRESLEERALRADERVTDADEDLQCEFCWPGSIESGAC